MGYIGEAVRKMKQSKEIKICKASSVYETQPVEYKNQPWFLNMVLEVETTLEPLNLLELFLGIESQMGRKRTLRYGPRNIDLDLLLYDEIILNSDRLTLPHPRMHEREFVLVPLVEVAPKVVHPLLKKSMERLLEELSTDSIQTDGRLPASGKDKFEVRLYSEKAGRSIF